MQCLEPSMNERIKELWDKAAELESDPSWEGQTKFIEKFAELVVRECAGIVENQGRFIKYDILATKIKDHFEIKK
jgi:hypothetical protein